MSFAKYFNDPEWWFSAVITGIVISVAAGFLKDWIARAVGILSNKLKARSEARKARRAALIEALANSPDYLALEWNRVLLQTIMFIGTTIIFLLLPLSQGHQPCSAESACSAIQAIVSLAAYPFFGGLSIASGYKASSRLKPLSEALKFYREKNNLPKLS